MIPVLVSLKLKSKLKDLLAKINRVGRLILIGMILFLTVVTVQLWVGSRFVQEIDFFEKSTI